MMKLSNRDKLNGIQTKRIETHAHTSEGSPCGKLSACDTVKLYAQTGFEVLILTNHYSDVVIPHMENTAEQRAERYIENFIRCLRKENAPNHPSGRVPVVEDNSKKSFLIIDRTKDGLHANGYYAASMNENVNTGIDENGKDLRIFDSYIIS